jgi:hypothetical protein
MSKGTKNKNKNISIDEQRIAWKKEIISYSFLTDATKLENQKKQITIRLNTLTGLMGLAASKVKDLQQKIQLLETVPTPNEHGNSITLGQAKKNLKILNKTVESYMLNIKRERQALAKMGHSLNKTAHIFNENAIQTQITVEWENITFEDSFIRVKYSSKSLEKFQVENSKQSLNIIKSHYKFRNAPKLILKISENRIVKIENIEVLFYYIQFLKNAGTIFRKLLNKTIVNFIQYKGYHKSYYKKHLPEIFLPRCFTFLCKHSSDDLQIIPIPETVINSSGSKQIHDSFLFPILKHTCIYWYWESVEESKATYLFLTDKSDFESNIQTVYDYLTGSTINKRETLIHDKKLQLQLGMANRLMHTDFESWKNEVRKH